MLNKFEVYRFAKTFHWSCLELRLHRNHREQLFRASSSIVLNIAEGSGKNSQDDQRRFFRHALESLRECQAILELEKINNPEILGLMDKIEAILFKLSYGSRKAESENGPQNPDTQTVSGSESGDYAITKI